MIRHSTRASPALQALGEADPAMAVLALWCDHRDGTCDMPALTTGSLIEYGPAFDALPRHEQIGVAAHHIMHVALRHTARMQAMQARFAGGFDPAVYNIATDAIVNEALLLAGFALPRPALTLTGLLEATLGLRAPAAQALADWDADRLYVRLMQGGDGKGGTSGRARSHAASRNFAQDMQASGDDSQTHPAQVSDGEADKDADWRQHLARAMESGRLAGRGIGMLGHRLADIPKPRTPWEVILRGLVTRAVTQHPQPSYRRPSRHWIAAEADALRRGDPIPAFQPGTVRATPLPRIALALDTSSSIDDARLGLFMAEVAGIARRTTAELHLILFDEVVQNTLRLDPSRWQSQLGAVQPARGGGTSFAPALACAIALQPSIIVVLTDLEGDFGPAPRLPVIWCAADAQTAPSPPFGIVLDLGR